MSLNITQTLEQAIYGYDNTEFMPIYEGAEWVNKGAFIAYKIGRARQHVGEVMIKGAEALDTYIQSAQ
jgi:hypothetical protein